jgi:Lipopolysaccharide-assembly
MTLTKATLPVFLLLWCSCGFYTFSGSTLPSHLKTVDIPLFANQSLMPGVAEEVTDALTKRILSMNLLRIVSGSGDATIHGSVVDYSNTPRNYSTTGVRQVSVSEYAVHITVDVEFTDNKAGSSLFKGKITGEGIYDFTTQNEALGRTNSEKDVVDQILQHSVQSW